MFNLFKKKEKKAKILPVDKHIKMVMKNKSLSANQKFEQIKERFALYYMYEMLDDANMATFELHYESFMRYDKANKKYVKDVEEYEDCFNYELKKNMYYHSVQLAKVVDKLEQDGLDEKSLSHYSQLFLKRITTLKTNCGYDEKDFPYDQYYTNIKVKNHVDRFTKYFFDDFENDIKDEIDFEKKNNNATNNDNEEELVK